MELRDLYFFNKLIILCSILILLFILDFVDKFTGLFNNGVNLYLESIIVRVILIFMLVIIFKLLNIKIFAVVLISKYIYLKITFITLTIIVLDYLILTDKGVNYYDISSNLIMLFIYMVVFVPIYEELIYRYLLMSVFNKPKVIGLIISTVVFTLAHNPNDLGSFIYYIIMSLFLSITFIKYNSIELCIYIHTLTNFIGFISIL